MELHIMKKSKIFCLAILLLVGLSIFVSVGTSAYAEELSGDNEVIYDSSYVIQERSKGGYKATRIIECKKYGNCKSPVKQIWDNAKKVWKKYH